MFIFGLSLDFIFFIVFCPFSSILLKELNLGWYLGFQHFALFENLICLDHDSLDIHLVEFFSFLELI
jgi:hypothetical protein